MTPRLKERLKVKILALGAEVKVIRQQEVILSRKA